MNTFQKSASESVSTLDGNQDAQTNTGSSLSKARRLRSAKTRSSKNTVVLMPSKGVSKKRQLADVALSPIASNANTARTFGEAVAGEIDITSAMEVLREKAAAVVSGDLSSLEATLVSQAAALESIFNSLALRAIGVIDRHLNAGEQYLRLALKAQSQCRATLQTLAEIKNPPTIFARQANIANGPQQVNNDTTASRAREIENQQNKLLGHTDGERMDAGASVKTSRTNSSMGALAVVHRTEVTGGQGQGISECL